MLPIPLDGVPDGSLGVVPVLVGPLQALVAILPGILVALAGLFLSLFKPATMKKLFLLLISQWFAVLIIVGIGVGFYFVAPYAFPGKVEQVNQAASGTDWPVWRGDVARRGAVLNAQDPAHGGLRWRFVEGNVNTFYASPAIVGNRLYITSVYVTPYDVTGTGAIYSIDTDSGKVVWKYSAEGYRATFSSPAVKGNYLVVGEGLHEVRDGRVFCLDIAASEKQRKGVKLWDYRTRSHVESSPAVGEDRMCIGAGDDGLYCFALTPGLDGGPVLLWHKEGKDYPDCEASPVIHDGRVYFGLGIGGNALVCVGAVDGKEHWRVRTPYPAFGSPTVADGKVYVGMGTGNYIQTAEQVQAVERQKMQEAGKSEAEIEEAMKALAPAGEVWAIDLETHEVAWKFPVRRTVLGAIAAADGKLYFGSRDGHLYCLGTDGREAGKWNAHAPIITSPSVGKDHVYVVTETGMLYGLKLPKLEPVWEIDLMSPALSSPAVAHGHVFVGTNTNGLLCLGLPGVLAQEPLWGGELGGPGRSGWTEGQMMGAQGRFAWRWPEESGKTKITSPIAFQSGALYVGIDEQERKGLLKLNPPAEASQKPAEAWIIPTANPVTISPAAAPGDGKSSKGDLVFCVDGTPGQTGRILRCVDEADGSPVWSAPVAEDASGRFTLTRSRLLIADRAHGLSSFAYHTYSAEGTPLQPEWSSAFGPVVGDPCVERDLGVVAVSDPPQIILFDVPTGTALWRKGLDAAPTVAPLLSGERIWRGGADGLHALDVVTGDEVLKIDAGAVAGRIIEENGRVACVNASGQAVVADASTGEVLTGTDKVDAALPPMLAGENVLYFDGKAILVRAIAGDKSDEWLRRRDFSWMGKPVAPMIAVEGGVFLATDRMGLICIQPKKEP